MAKDKKAYIALIPLMFTKGVTRIFFHWGKDRRPRAGWGSWGEAATPSPPARGSEKCCELPAGFVTEPQSPKGFPLFSALRMASPDTIILLIVDYHAAIVGRPPCLLAYAPIVYREIR